MKIFIRIIIAIILILNVNFEPLVYAKEVGLKSKNKNQVSFCCVGDSLLNTRILETSHDKQGYHFDKVFTDISDKISSYDISAINQETVLVDDKDVSARPYGSPKTIASALINCGFNVILHQNNHMFDKGLKAFEKSNAFWRRENVVNVGFDNKPVYYKKNGITFNFYNYTYGVTYYYNKLSLKEYRETKKKTNLLDRDKKKLLQLLKSSSTNYQICFLHIGEEYSTKIKKEEKKYIVDLIDAGADVVICSHPHVVRKYGMVKTKKGNQGLVYYSCGNFLATQEIGSFDNQIGGLASVIFEKEKIKEYSFVPTICHYTSKKVRVMLLNDYSDKEAKKALLHKQFKGYTYKNLLLFWKKTILEK